MIGGCAALFNHTQSFSEWMGYRVVIDVFDAALATDIDDGIDVTDDHRRSDAMFALLAGDRFACECDRADCDAQIPEAQQLGDVHGRIVIHVVADASTVAGGAESPGFVDGHGVISGDHVKDLVARDDSTTRPLGPQTVPDHHEPDGDEPPEGDLLDPHLPSDPYRPSTALDTYIRIRDGYYTIATAGSTTSSPTRTAISVPRSARPKGSCFPARPRTTKISSAGSDTSDSADPTSPSIPRIHPRARNRDDRRPRTADKHARRRAQRRRNRLIREGKLSRVEGHLAAYLESLGEPPF